VNKRGVKYLDFEVDKLTKSIENVATGDSFVTEISAFKQSDTKFTTKSSGWLFDWKKELALSDREVYKLTIQNNPGILQGVVSFTLENDHVYMPLIESAPFNRGKNKVYLGVPGNLVAFGCRLSYQKGFGGFLSFHAKTKLIPHYHKTLGALPFSGQLMIIGPLQSEKLVSHYFKS